MNAQLLSPVKAKPLSEGHTLPNLSPFALAPSLILSIHQINGREQMGVIGLRVFSYL